MHITDWFSSAWTDKLGQKSTSIVSDGLIGHFDPENPNSYDGEGLTFHNLIGGGLHMELMNGIAFNWYSPAGQIPKGLPCYFESDGTDNYIGPEGLDYYSESSSFFVDGSADFTISMWINPWTAYDSFGGSNTFFSSLGSMTGPHGIGIGAKYGHHAVAWGRPISGGVWDSDFRVSGPLLIAPSSSNDLTHLDWQYIAVTKKTNRPYGEGNSKLTFYLNGIETLMGATSYGEFGDAMPSSRIVGNQYLYVGGCYNTLMNMVQSSQNLFGIILVYNRALKRKELRQNFLATRTTHRYFTPGRRYRYF